MSATELYDIWFRRFLKLLPGERITRVRLLAWMMVGLYLGQSVHLKQIATKLPFRARRRSTVQRFSRFLQNEHFRVRPWYREVAGALLGQVARHSTAHLLIDSTKVGSGHQLLMVALAFRKRALPIAWDWIEGKRGHSGVDKQLALLRYVHHLLPDEAEVDLVGDSEFGAVALMKQLEQWGWQYALRQRGNIRVCVSQEAKWQSLAEVVPARDKPFWYAQAILTLEHLHHTSVLTIWQTGEKDPWLLANNMPTARHTMRAYGRRMWIDEMYGDWKGHGVDLEKTRLRHVDRLSRLVFLVALLYLWLITRGSQAIKQGLRHLVDRKSRRDLSLVRIGLDITHWLSASGRSFSIRLLPYF